MLKIENLSVHYGIVEALSPFSFSLKQGELVTILGANGAGKSTALRAISKLLKPSSGRVIFSSGGQDITISDMQPHDIVALGISHVPEGRGLFLNLSIFENLDLGAWPVRDSKKNQEDLDLVLKIFPRLKERLKQNAGTLSGGEQQMLALGRALMARPKLLLLDEPSLGLSPQMVELIFQVIADIHKMGTTVLFVEQNAYQALHIAHRGLVFENGKLVLSGTSQELLASPQVQEAYLGG
ncbi:MAG: ABC transporter ATP-binding protein [Deltaproteobacteria bacterium]|nr:ABC transporter ATP-binding protein [Deltaproteobacteria bacterium]